MLTVGGKTSFDQLSTVKFTRVYDVLFEVPRGVRQKLDYYRSCFFFAE